jgi:exopolysaccharide biosynthesis polyprenyl glycosylphosphotransferase
VSVREIEPAAHVVPYGETHARVSDRRVLAPAAERTRRRLIAAADVLALSVSLMATSVAAARPRPDYRLLAVLPAWLVLNKMLGLYAHDGIVINKSTLHELPRLAESLLIGAAAIVLLGPLAGVPTHRGQAVEFVILGLALIAGARCAMRCAIRQSYGPERTVIAGSGHAAALLARKLRSHPEYGLSVIGYVDTAPSTTASECAETPLLGDASRFAELCAEFEVKRVVVAFSALERDRVLDLIRASHALGVKVSILPPAFEVLGRSVLVDEVEGISLLTLPGTARSRSELAAKRLLDVAGSAVLLLLLAPLLAMIAAAIKLTSRGPVVFAQTRVGRGQKPFKMLKFRTMVVGADELKQGLAHLNEAQAPMFKMAADPRITPVGRFLRRTSLDELPQLWNVLRGEMSLVGPRPLVPPEDAQVIGWHRARLDLGPGLTGPWQVLGRTAIPFQEMIDLDYRYVADWSLWNDVKLLLRTAPVVLRRRGL